MTKEKELKQGRLNCAIEPSLYSKLETLALTEYGGNFSMAVRQVVTHYFLEKPEKGLKSQD